jgi:hypothetical protein
MSGGKKKDKNAVYSLIISRVALSVFSRVHVRQKFSGAFLYHLGAPYQQGSMPCCEEKKNDTSFLNEGYPVN